ncbi:ABC transporter permease [candidate division KSB1 bacterium]
MTNKNIQQPKIGKLLLKKFTRSENQLAVMGDFEEEYLAVYKEKGIVLAWMWYWIQVFKSFPSFFINHFIWSKAMFKNYLKTAFRNLKKQKVLTLINVLGLSIGIAACILIYLHISDEISYDGFHKKSDRIYRIVTGNHNPDGSLNRSSYLVPAPVGDELTNYFSEFEKSVRIFYDRVVVRFADEIHSERITFADRDFFNVFSFELIKGNPWTALDNDNSIVLKENKAVKYFGNEDPLGKTMTLSYGNYKKDFIVTGVCKEVPGNSSVGFDILANVETPKVYEKMLFSSWGGFTTRTFVLVKENVSLNGIDEKFSSFIKQYLSSAVESAKQRGSWKNSNSDKSPYSFSLQNIKDIHLDPNIRGGTDPRNLVILTGIALIILLIACINFMNLSIGNASGRFKEVGVRKIIGAERKQLIAQFWTESILLAFMSVIFGLLLAVLIFPAYNNLTGKSFNVYDIIKINNLAGIAAVFVLASIFSGSYPALLMSGFMPVQILQGKLKIGGKNLLTKSLVILQFALSAFLIISTLVMGQQIRFMLNKDLGYEKNGLIIIRLQQDNDKDARRLKNIFKENVIRYPGIKSVAATSIPFGDGPAGTTLTIEGKEIEFCFYNADFDYVNTMGLEIKEGRDFSSGFSTDSSAALVNEAFVKEAGLKNPSGLTIENITIIGVVKDFNFESLHNKIGPAVITPVSFIPINTMLVRINPSNITSTLRILQNTWKDIQPDKPFIYSFHDDDLKELYDSEIKWQTIILYASIAAFLIACMGILGLMTISISRRIKEIGIRKVMGAGVMQIIGLLVKNYVFLVLTANILIWPAAYFAMNRFLENYHYRVEISIFYFLFSGILSLVIAVSTISYIAVRTANMNPVDSLRYE